MVVKQEHEDRGVLAKDGPLYRLAMLAPMVEARADVNAALRKAARAYLDNEKAREGPPTWGVLRNFCNAWNNTPLAEKKAVLNGWLPRDPMPNAEAVLCWTRHSPVIGVLRVTCEPEGQVELYPDYEADDGGLDCVTLTVKEGTDGATVMAGLRAITAALEKHWDKAIELAPREGITVPAEEQWRGGHAPVELALEGVAMALAGVQAALGTPAAVVGDAKAGDASKGPLEKAVGRIAAAVLAEGGDRAMRIHLAHLVADHFEAADAAQEKLESWRKKRPQTGLKHTRKLSGKSVRKTEAA